MSFGRPRGDVRFLVHNVLHAVAGLLWFLGMIRAGDRVHAIWPRGGER